MILMSAPSLINLPPRFSSLCLVYGFRVVAKHKPCCRCDAGDCAELHGRRAVCGRLRCGIHCLHGCHW